MMPNVDPKMLKSMMDRMGIKTSEVPAESVTIHCSNKDIVITSPQVTRIEAQGVVSFQVAGRIDENSPISAVEITDDDINTVMEQSGVSDREKAKRALQDSNGDIAEAILSLKG